MRLFVLAARFKRPSLAKPQTDEATGADRSNLFRQRNHGAKSFRIRPRQLRRAERRQTHCRDARTQAACGTRHGECGLRRPPLAGALACRDSTCGFRQQDFRPEGSASGQASQGRCESCGVPHAPPRLQRCTSRAGRIAGRHDTRAARVRIVSFRPRAPHSLRRQGVPSSDGVL
jgi:hypothetical protein